MKVLFLYVSTNMCRDGDLWFYDEGLASTVSVMRERGHNYALRLVGGRDSLDDVLPWIEAERDGTDPLIVFLTSVHFSAYAHDIPNTFAQVQGVRESTGLRTMFIGIWATLNAKRLIKHPGIDMVGRGEMEYALPDVCDALERGQEPHGIQNIWSKSGDEQHRSPLRPLIPDLDQLPFPTRDILPIAEHANESDGILTVIGSRGCPMSCEFCTHVVVRKAYDVSPAAYMRTKSVDYMLREIRACLDTIPRIWAIYFHDDMFMLSKDWRDEFFRRYPKEVGLPFGCNMIIEQVKPDLIAELSAAGCTHALIGVESGSEHMRTNVFSKPLSDDQIEAALKLCWSHGLRVKFYALLGAPEESRKDLVDSLKGFARYCADMVQVQVWLAHETSDLLELDPDAATTAQRQYDPRGDKTAWRLKFYFHYYHRYVALYHLLNTGKGHKLLRRIVRAFVTLSVRLPFAPEMLVTRDWTGQARWPRRFRFLGRLAMWCLGGFGRKLRNDVIQLEQRLAADYLRPEGLETPGAGWRGNSRIDRRLEQARETTTV